MWSCESTKIMGRADFVVIILVFWGVPKPLGGPLTLPTFGDFFGTQDLYKKFFPRI